MIQTGYTALVFGNETGSSRMLEIMQKKVSLEDNYNAAKWTVEAKLGNVIQLVMGMPGESLRRFVKRSNTLSSEHRLRMNKIRE
jgi:anaerobic magnesium-protoporphyrin IX monomethyl ester cyclase